MSLLEVQEQKQTLRRREVREIAEPKVPKSPVARKPTQRRQRARSPYEICQLYARKKITRAQLVSLLAAYRYDDAARTDGYDDLLVNSSNSWAEVVTAYTEGLISSKDYKAIFDRRHS